jgi:PKD repeat protein
MKTLRTLTFVLLLLLLCFRLPGQSMDDPCKASFVALPDSSSSFPFMYHFKDQSTGVINEWLWEFGDGTASSEKNPSHQYDAPGTYAVCLTIGGANDTITCSDQYCFEISTLDYFSLGGLAYAGEYPLNNPVINGDTGVASLYRIINDQIVFVEDHYFTEYGYFWFGYLFSGQYMIKVGLTAGSPNYHNYFTTYYGDETSWTKADLINVSTTSQYEAEIHLIPVKELATSFGTIRGYVKFEQGNAYSMPPISQTTVILADKYHTPLQFTQPNPEGYFEFSGIPFDSYYLNADATGKPSSTVNIILSENAPLVEGINLTVFGSNVNYIPEEAENSILLASVYPNPAGENLNISLYSGISSPVLILVTDVTGKNHFKASEMSEKGLNHYTIPTSTLPPGVYLLQIRPEGSYRPISTRFIK